MATPSKGELNVKAIKEALRNGVQEFRDLFEKNKEEVNTCFDLITGHAVGKGEEEHPQYNAKYDLSSDRFKSCKYVCDYYNNIMGNMPKYSEYLDREEAARKQGRKIRDDKKTDTPTSNNNVISFD